MYSCARTPARLARLIVPGALALAVAACAPAAPPPPTAAPAKVAPTAAPAKQEAKPTAPPAAKPAATAAPAVKPAASPAAKPAEKPADKPAAKTTDFFAGKTLHFGVGFTPGGGFDLQSRLLARTLPKYLPGNPRIQVENRPGAGSLTLANELFNTDPKDGLYFGMITETAVFSARIGAEGIRFDPLKVNWLGSPELNSNACTVRGDSGVKSMQDMIAGGKTAKMGSTGTTSSNYQYPVLLNAVAGAKFQVVGGYPGIAEVLLAIEKGEVHGICSGWVDTIRRFPDKIKSGEWAALVQNGLEKDPEIAKFGNVPHVDEFLKTEQDKRLFRALSSSGAISKPIAAPPGVPADRVAALQDAFDKTFKDPEWLDEARKQPNFVVGPKTGAQVGKVVQEFMATPDDVVAKLKQILTPS